MPATEGSWQPVAFGRSESRAAVRWIALASVAIALAVATFLVARRLAGALTMPLPVLPLITTASVALAWVWAARIAASRSMHGDSNLSPRVEWVITWWLPSIALMLLAVACSYPGERIVDWVIWLPVIGASWWLPRRWWHAAPASRRLAAANTHAASAQSSHGAEQVLQQLTRIRTADGSEIVCGTLTAEFAPGERTVTLHAAFCPPFERLPHVEAEVDDVAATIKIAQVLHNGVRFDVRLAKPATVRHDVCVELSATEIRE